MSSRFSSVYATVLASQTVGLVGSVILATAAAEPPPAISSLGWAFAAGLAGVVGLGCFYYALARGTMGVVAPITAVIGAGLPVLVGIIAGEQLELVRGLGIVVALAGVVLISLPAAPRTLDERRRLRIDLGELPLVVGAGIGFGLFFLFLNAAGQGGQTWWPLAVVRLTGSLFMVGAVLVAVARTRAPSVATRADIVFGLPKVRARALPLPALAALFLITGLGDLGGNAFFILATRADELSVAVVLSSLYPVVTTLLAAAFLRERLRAVQVVGVLFASLSVPLLR